MAVTGPAVFPSQPVTTTYPGAYPGTAAVPGGSEFPGDAITPTANLYPGSGTFPGQGPYPILWALYSTSDASAGVPTWISVSSSDLRTFSISRGRSSELGEIEAGTAEITLDNRDRQFDPTVNSSIRPLNRWWLREQFAGETQDMFKGYAERYQQQWPGGGWSDAECVVSCTDEMKVLALASLPETNPPRDSYANVVLFDHPTGYWGMGDNSFEFAQSEVQDTPPAHIPVPSAHDIALRVYEVARLRALSKPWAWTHGGM